MQSQVKDEKQKHFLKLEQPLEFKSTVSGIITTAMELSKQINGLFGIFTDYEGCALKPNSNGEVSVTLYWRDKGGKEVVPIYEQNRGADVKSRIMNFNNIARGRNKTYKFADHVKEVLEQFVKNPGNKNVNIDNMSYEAFEPTYGGAGTIYLQIDNIDINKILKTLYGDKAPDGSRYEYNVSFIKPINAMPGIGVPNYLFKIDRLDSKQVEEIASKIGMIATVGTLPIIRER